MEHCDVKAQQGSIPIARLKKMATKGGQPDSLYPPSVQTNDTPNSLSDEYGNLEMTRILVRPRFR